MEYYRCGALDALWDLANMPMSPNSSMMQIKYLAANRLAGPAPTTGEVSPRGAGATDILAELNERFHSQAPKIREVRERITTFETETEPKAIN